MSEHQANLKWKLETDSFEYKEYNRNFELHFDSGTVLKGSATLGYLGDASKVDPEEMLVGSLSACHMLTFLALAANKKLGVTKYTDDAVGFLEKNEKGRLAITRITLKPKVLFDEPVPTQQELQKIHDSAHKACFISNSIRAEVSIEIASF